LRRACERQARRRCSGFVLPAWPWLRSGGLGANQRIECARFFHIRFVKIGRREASGSRAGCLGRGRGMRRQCGDTGNSLARGASSALYLLAFSILVRFAVSPKWPKWPPDIAAMHRAVPWFRQKRPVLRHIEFARIFAGNCFAKTTRSGSAPLRRSHGRAMGVRPDDTMQSGAPTPVHCDGGALHIVLTGICQMGSFRRFANVSSPIASVPTLHWPPKPPHYTVSCNRPIV